MFVTLAPRLATSFAIAVGTVAGGVLAFMHTPPPAGLVPEVSRELDERVVARAARPEVDARSPPRATGYAPPPAAPSVVAPPAPSTAASKDLIPAPHDSPVLSEAELRKAERLCIRNLRDECVRAEDAYVAGKV